MDRCSFRGKTLPSPSLLSLFLIRRVCRKFLTYTGQGNLHAFLELFLALDWTAISALLADGWVSHPSPFSQDTRTCTEVRNPELFLWSIFLIAMSTSKLSGGCVGQQWPRGCFLHSVWPWWYSFELKFPVCRQRREGQQARASMSEVDLCFLFSLSSFDCFPYSFRYSSSNLYGKQNLSCPWTCLPICLLSLWSWSVDVFASLPSSPQVTLHLFLLFLPKHVARFWTLTLTFRKYRPSLCHPYLHRPQVPRHCQFWTPPSMPASVLTDQLHPALQGSASCTLCLLLPNTLVLSHLETYHMCEKVGMSAKRFKSGREHWQRKHSDKWWYPHTLTKFSCRQVLEDSCENCFEHVWQGNFLLWWLLYQYFLSRSRVKIFVK